MSPVGENMGTSVVFIIALQCVQISLKWASSICTIVSFLFSKENCWMEIGFAFATIWLCIGTQSKPFLNHLMSSSSGVHNSYANFPALLAASSICQDLHSYLGCLTQLSMNECNFTYLLFCGTNISSSASACQVLYQGHQRLRYEWVTLP